MGRRSIHSSDELREIILEASTDIIRQEGFSRLSAREIARRIDYSPGTLYNIFENLNDLVLTVEGRVLDALIGALAEVSGDDPSQKIQRLAERYIQFTQDNAQLWNLLFEHNLPSSRPVPAWYQQKLDQLLTKVQEALEPWSSDMGPDELRRSALVLWSGLHGIAALASAQKLAMVSHETAAVLLNDLVRNYLAGLRQNREKPESAAETPHIELRLASNG